MGTWTLFSTDYCANKSTCVLIDAWLQLALCVLAVIVVVALCNFLTGCCQCLRCCKPREGDEFYSEESMVRRVLGRAHLTKSSGRRLWSNLRNRTSPLPVSVIRKDARAAQILSHKNSQKHGAHFIKQTQRMSRMDIANMQVRGQGDNPSLNSDNSSNDRKVESFRAATGPDGLGGTQDKRRLTPRITRTEPLSSKAGFAIPMINRRGSRHPSFVADSEAGQAPLNDPSTSADPKERLSSFRSRLVTAFTPPDFFIKRNTVQLTRPASRKSFEGPSYEMKHELAELSPDDRLVNERRSSMELRDKRRLSVGSSSQLQFQVGGDKASVYEVKLKEINLVKRLAFGPLSEVYAAIWRDTKVGVKLLMPREGVVDHLAEAVKNFRREIWVMSSLKHPNILKLIGASLTPSCYVLVMEYMSNGSLYEYLRDEANFFPSQMVIQCAYDIAAGMSYIHQCGILQRDLKSKNCLLSENLVVKVADFGLARYKSKLYGQYTFVGTPFWAAPEVIRHEDYDEKADVYSYAIVLWELIERKDPYETLNAYQVPLLIANDGLRPAEFTNAAPLGLDHIMKQCWDADPEQRPTFAEIAETLEKWLRPDEESEDLSMHIQREQTTATEEELHFFASSHDVNEKVIPIQLSRMQSRRSLLRKPSFSKTGSERSIASTVFSVNS